MFSYLNEKSPAVSRGLLNFLMKIYPLHYVLFCIHIHMVQIIKVAVCRFDIFIAIKIEPSLKKMQIFFLELTNTQNFVALSQV